MRRVYSIDVARGIIIAIMALDHCKGAWYEGGYDMELGFQSRPVTVYSTPGLQITREITHICAPGFQLLAGLGLALSVAKRRQAGVDELVLSLDIAARGVVLMLCDWILMYYAFGKSTMLFLVLACIGASTVLFSVLRFLPRHLIGILGVGVLMLQPFYSPTGISAAGPGNYLRNIWTHIALDANAWNVIYPVFPWVGYFGIGWWLADGYLNNRKWLGWPMIAAGSLLFVIGVAGRWTGSNYWERMPGGAGGPTSAAFWVVAKYPPTPTFTLWTVGAVLALLGSLRWLDKRETLPTIFWPMEVFGKTALFFFVVHFYLYGLYPALQAQPKRYGLNVNYAIWLAGLCIMLPLCWGYSKLREKHRSVLRYF